MGGAAGQARRLLDQVKANAITMTFGFKGIVRTVRVRIYEEVEKDKRPKVENEVRAKYSITHCGKDGRGRGS